jgi:hypothetical protein
MVNFPAQASRLSRSRSGCDAGMLTSRVALEFGQGHEFGTSLMAMAADAVGATQQ